MIFYSADYETTVDNDTEAQTETEVWAWVVVRGEITSTTQEVGRAILGNSIDSFFQYLHFYIKDKNPRVYFHNLKFDGTFILSWLIDHGFKRSDDEYKLRDGEYTTLISDMGSWYYLKYRYRGNNYTIIDSLKLMPMSLEKLGKDFKTAHQKSTMEYKGERHAGGTFTPEERHYIENDGYVLCEALMEMFKLDYTKLTIGSCCINKFKSMFDKNALKEIMPDLVEDKIDYAVYGSEDSDEYIRRSYHGGWCYCKEPNTYYENVDGRTYDVNSLYPSVMHSKSGSFYPFGLPNYFVNEIPDFLFGDTRYELNDLYYFFVRVSCKFELKEGYLPFIQIKGDIRYKRNEMLTSSKPHYRFREERPDNDRVTMTLTCVDYLLFHKHYNVTEETVLDGCWFLATRGIFDGYIDTFFEMKKQATLENNPSKRVISKLSLNNLYGKLSTNRNAYIKVPRIEDGILKFSVEKSEDKKAGFIPIGSAITSWARKFTIDVAQANYPYFKYADTDSVHLVMTEGKEPVGMKIDKTELCCWDFEKSWHTGIFVRQKTYIEVDDKGIDVKCAGMPANCKEYFVASVEQNYKGEDITNLTAKQIAKKYDLDIRIAELMAKKLTLHDFKEGLTIYGKLLPVQVRGGTLLRETYFTLKQDARLN